MHGITVGNTPSPDDPIVCLPIQSHDLLKTHRLLSQDVLDGNRHCIENYLLKRRPRYQDGDDYRLIEADSAQHISVRSPIFSRGYASNHS